MKSKVLWLSNLTDSNDTQEVTRTFCDLWETVKKKLLESDLDSNIITQEIEMLDHQYQLEIQVDKPYGICFCREPDVLLQWLEYGDRTRGVVLGFDFDWFNGLERNMPHPSVNFIHTVGYEQVLYHDDRIEEGIYKICYDAIKEYGLQAWIIGGIRFTFKHYSAFIKNPKNFEEQEVRIVYYPDYVDSVPDNFLGITGPVDEPVTHYCLPWTNGNGDNALKAIGLGCNCELNEADLRTIMTSTGVSGRFDLFKSKCSYRLKN